MVYPYTFASNTPNPPHPNDPPQTVGVWVLEAKAYGLLIDMRVIQTPEVMIFQWKKIVFYMTASRRHLGAILTETPQHLGGKDNSVPAEDVHNKNPSLVTLGTKNCFS